MNTHLTLEDSDNWARCYAAFMRHLWDKSHSSATVFHYRRVLTEFFSRGKPVENYTKADVEEYIHTLTHGQRSRGKPPSTASINQKLFILKSFFSWATEYTIESPDGRPMRLLQTLPPTTGLHAGQPARSYKALSEQELAKLFSVIDRSTVLGARDYAALLFYTLTARRRSELIALTYGSIKPTILIENDTRRDGFLFVFKGKGASQSDDVQELPSSVKAAIDTYLEMSGRAATIKADDPLFVATDLNKGITFDKSRALNDESMARRFKFYCRKAGLSEKYGLHSLRHSSALLRFQHGEPLTSVQRTLRHRSVATTSIYIDGLAATVDNGARKLEVLFAQFS